MEGRILSATIRRNPSGKYFVAILTETEVQAIEKTGSVCGIDLGNKHFAKVSDHTERENQGNFPSSQLCSSCGFVHKDVKDLAVRNWSCPACGALHDRDLMMPVFKPSKLKCYESHQ